MICDPHEMLHGNWYLLSLPITYSKYYLVLKRKGSSSRAVEIQKLLNWNHEISSAICVTLRNNQLDETRIGSAWL